MSGCCFGGNAGALRPRPEPGWFPPWTHSLRILLDAARKRLSAVAWGYAKLSPLCIREKPKRRKPRKSSLFRGFFSRLSMGQNPSNFRSAGITGGNCLLSSSSLIASMRSRSGTLLVQGFRGLKKPPASHYCPQRTISVTPTGAAAKGPETGSASGVMASPCTAIR